MALVDAKYRFLYCDVGCNGRVSDGGVFAQTSLQDSLSNKTANIPTPTFLPGTDQLMSFHIVADEAFPLREDIMKPYHNRNLTEEQRIFNYRLSRARRVVENAFRILVNRFRVFTTTIALAPEKVEKIVLASCALHNFLRSTTDTEWVQDADEETTNLPSVGIPHNANTTNAAKDKRNVLANYFISEEGAVEWQKHMI